MTVSSSAAPIPVSRISTDLDFEQDGKQVGYLTVPHSRNESAWGSLLMPIACIKHGAGPTILFTGGSHGDEYEGPIALSKLIRNLECEHIQGRVIIIPGLNAPAQLAGTRLSPVDGKNMNRVFPGDRTGTMTEVIAHYVYTVLLPLCDVVLDLHSGGTSLDFVPSAIMHYLDDPTQMAKTLAALKAFGAPVGLVLTELDTEGMLDTAVEESGKLFLSTELGGGAGVSVEALRVAEQGVVNVLRHFGILQSDALGFPKPLESASQATRLMEVPDGSCYVIAPSSGVYEPFYDLGDTVTAAEPIGQIHHLDQPDRPSELLYSQQSGMLLCRRSLASVSRGDCVAVVAIASTLS
ncbi:MAG: succinylglutamate desuccinylase/aspartoacylase family protein [Elainellaceae cyanobacterium]